MTWHSGEPEPEQPDDCTTAKEIDDCGDTQIQSACQIAILRSHHNCTTSCKLGPCLHTCSLQPLRTVAGLQCPRERKLYAALRFLRTLLNTDPGEALLFAFDVSECCHFRELEQRFGTCTAYGIFVHSAAHNTACPARIIASPRKCRGRTSVVEKSGEAKKRFGARFNECTQPAFRCEQDPTQTY